MLRFPKDQETGEISKTADLVLGQKDFVTGGKWARGDGLDKMRAPSALRFGPSGKLYVADTENNRVLVFNPPFISGMSASSIFGSQIRYPLGLEIDPAGEGLWITDNGNGMVELWDWNGTTVKKVLGKDTYQPDGTCHHLCKINGAVGIDALGNILVVRSQVHEVYLYSSPIPDPTPGSVYQPSKELFSTEIFPNKLGAKGLGVSVKGIEVSANQLIVADSYRFLFWNNPANLSNGKPADGVIIPGPPGQAHDFTTRGWEVSDLQADGAQRLWALIYVGGRAEIWTYELPLTTGALPINKITMPLPILGGGSLDLVGFVFGIAPVGNGDFVWISHRNTNRVIRIRNPLTNPQVDVILGQTDLTGTACNRGEVPDAVVRFRRICCVTRVRWR